MINEAKIRENDLKMATFIDQKFKSGELDNRSLVKIIEQCGDYLNLKTPSAYRKAHGLSYNGVRKCRNVQKIFGVRFVVDNI